MKMRFPKVWSRSEVRKGPKLDEVTYLPAPTGLLSKARYCKFVMHSLYPDPPHDISHIDDLHLNLIF